jgi:hypothetical protein
MDTKPRYYAINISIRLITRIFTKSQLHFSDICGIYHLMMEVRQLPTDKIHRRKFSSDENHDLALLPNGDLQSQPQTHTGHNLNCKVMAIAKA